MNRATSQYLPALLFLGVLTASAAAAPVTDRVQLRNGNIVSGQVLSYDGRTLVLQTAQGIQTYPKEQIAAAFFGQAVQAGGLPPGLSVAEGLRVSR